MKNKELYAKNIRFLRANNRYTVKQIGNKTGIKASTWRSYEEGRAFPRHDKITVVLKALRFNNIVSLIEQDLSALSEEQLKTLSNYS